MDISRETRMNIAFRAPIPGSSLTKAPGSMPYEKPPQFVKLSDAMHSMMDQLTEPFYMKQLLQLMEMGVTIEAITRTLLFTGFCTGKWTVDLAMLMYRPLMLSVTAIAHRAGLHDTPFLIPRAVIDHHMGKQKSAAFTAHVKGLREKALAPTPKEAPVTEAPVVPSQGFMKPQGAP